ncbi:MAG: hypothetical protein ACKPKO_29710, partial [Candidatus Fonsibacter sp.]
DTKYDLLSKMEPTSVTGIFAGYELISGYRWGGGVFIWLGLWMSFRPWIFQSRSRDSPDDRENSQV